MSKISRADIVARTVALLRSGGYDATSMAQIAQACGIRKASLYHHFPEKDALALAALDHIHTHFRDHIFALAWRDGVAAKTRLRAVNDAVYTFFDDEAGGCLAANLALVSSERAPHFQAPLRAYFDDWAQTLAHLLASSHDRRKARRLAFAALARIQGALMLMRLYADRQHLRRALDETLAIL